MRPLRLRLHGFTCFRQEQDIDFAGLDLFAIAGPTGAGKTSILDAMVFALYGEVPRMGAQRLGELISLGLERAFAVLDFAIGPARYRVARRIRRHGAAQTQLERLDGGVAHPLAEGVREVEQAVKKLLGIDASTFLTAVILPQGQFADFLKSKPALRRGMLRSLLQLDIYERMRERANQRGRTAAHGAEALRTRLDDDFRDATPERLAMVERRLGDLATESHGAAEAAELARLRLEAFERAARLRRELDDARAALSELDALRAGIETDAQRVERSERAQPLLAILDRAAAARTRHQGTVDDVARLAPRARTALARHQEAAETARAASVAAAEIDDLSAARIRLESAMPLLARRTECQRRARQAHDQRDRAVQERETAVQEIADCARHVAGCVADLDALDRQLQRTGHDPDRLQRLSDALGPAAELVARRRDLARIRGTSTALDDRLRIAVDRRSSARRAADHAGEASRQADARHEQASSERDVARTAHAAHDLRAALSPGAPCPVCLQAVSTPPPTSAPPGLEAAVHEEQLAHDHRARCAADAQEARVALELAERAVLDTRASQDQTAGELTRVAGELEALGQRLARQLGELTSRGAPVLADDIPRLHADERSRADEHAGLEERGTELDAKIVGLRHRQSLLQQKVEAAERDRDRERLAAGDADAERAALEAQIQIAVPSGDPERERARLRERIDQLANARDEAIRAEQVVRAEHDAASRALAIAEVASATADSEAVAAHAIAVAEIHTADFATETAVRAAVLSAAERGDIAQRARTWHTRHAIATTRVAELAQSAGSGDVDASVLASARRDAGAARARHQELLEEQGRLGGERRELETRIAKATTLRDQLARARTERAIYDQLAADLRTDQLQAYLLEGAFRDIAEGASLRLRELSAGRYTLDYAHDDFFVVDHDNARERRRADTLSGGETFLTSLALALALSEQIQRVAGAVRLDSLFIDEGFGTLDAETLATVSDAIQQLGMGHRMVGIITHVQELTLALPTRIEVNRGAAGSEAKVISES